MAPYRCSKLSLNIIAFCVISIILLFYYQRNKYHQNKFNGEQNEASDKSGLIYENKTWNDLLMDVNLSRRFRPEFEKFIYTGTMGGGLGNQMYRFASLYAIGQMVGRTPAYVHNEARMYEIDEEMANTFPQFYERTYFLTANISAGAERINLGQGCCKYKNPEKILTASNQSSALELLGLPNFMSHKYFHRLRANVLDLFKFHPLVLDKMQILKDHKFSEHTHRLCLHIRVGDFVGIGETKSEQVGPAIEYVKRMLPRINNFDNKPVSLLMFGSDKNFLKSIKLLNDDGIAAGGVHPIIELNLSRGEELCVASIACDAFLITAPFSSFAFWMAYLMPDNVPIFVIRKIVPPDPLDAFTDLPPDWMQIAEEWLYALNKTD